jgi:serine/threonine-protein kinase
VTITLSVPGEVPDTDGLTIDQARLALQGAGYSVSSVRYTSEQGAGGRVVGTDPMAGTSVPPGSSVILIVNGSQQ